MPNDPSHDVLYEQFHAPLLVLTSARFQFRIILKTSPSKSNADNIEDNEDKNLSWLFNFKLDDIANLSPEIKRKRTNTNHQQQNVENNQQQPQQPQNFYNLQQQQFDDGNHQRSVKDPCIEDDLNVAENIVISNAPSYSSHT